MLTKSRWTRLSSRVSCSTETSSSFRYARSRWGTRLFPLVVAVSRRATGDGCALVLVNGCYCCRVFFFVAVDDFRTPSKPMEFAQAVTSRSIRAMRHNSIQRLRCRQVGRDDACQAPISQLKQDETHHYSMPSQMRWAVLTPFKFVTRLVYLAI